MKFLRLLVLCCAWTNLQAATLWTYIGPGAVGVSDGTSDISPTLNASTAVGDTIVCPVGYRGGNLTPSSTGPVYTPLFSYGTNSEHTFLARIATGTDSPTFTVSGGTGTSFQSVCLTFRGGPTSLSGIVVHSGSASNGSQANIGYPALTITTPMALVLVCGRKGDDSTSTDPIAGMTEVIDTSTVLGGDQTLACDYVIQTVATNIAGGSLVVNGGTNSSGTGAVIALHPLGCAGTEYQMAGGLLPLTFDRWKNPSRLYGSVPDLEDDSKVCVEQVVGAGTVVIDPDGAVAATETVTQFKHDYTVDGAYFGTLGTWDIKAIPPLFDETLTIPSQTYARNVAIIPYDLDNYSIIEGAALTGYTIKQLSSPVDTTFDAVGSGVDSILLTATSISGFNAADWIKVGSSYARIGRVIQPTSQLLLDAPITWGDGDAISTMTVGTCSISGISINGTTHNVEGTPDTVETNSLCFFRVTAADGQTGDTP